jgi:hypothetical protein
MLLAVYGTLHRFQPVQCSQALQLLLNAFVLPSLVTTGNRSDRAVSRGRFGSTDCCPLALEEMASLVTPDTILAWQSRLIAKTFDGSQQSG